MPVIFLMRHGQAENHARSDAMRLLTDYGKEYTQQIGNQLKDILVKYHHQLPRILHSPYRRAADTAKIIIDSIIHGHSPLPGSEEDLKLAELDTATPDTSPQVCFASLSSYSESSLILVSHMPLVASLASYIEHGNVFDAHPFQTSEIRAYEFERWIAGAGNLKFRLV